MGGGARARWQDLQRPAHCRSERRSGGKKAALYQSFTSDGTRGLLVFTEDPVACTRKNGHINVQGAAELTGQEEGEKEGVHSINTSGGGDVLVSRCK